IKTFLDTSMRCDKILFDLGDEVITFKFVGRKR
ncbi:hypothetical protein LCGC14_3155030, partial [marine sediment metagenome]